MDQSQFLSFGVAEELYALPLVQVREILRLPPITRLPGAPAFLRGVVNLRGAILPLVDLREELGLGTQPYGKFTVVIVIKTAGLKVGLIVDKVVDVVSVAPDAIAPPPPQLSPQVRAEFVRGLARTAEALLVVLDIDRLLTDEQRGILKASSAA